MHKIFWVNKINKI